MKASAEKMRTEADYAEQIARSATDPRKRELYERLAAHFRQLAGEIERVMAHCVIVRASGGRLDQLRDEASRISRGSKIDW